MLRWRLLLGTLFIGALVGLCWLDGNQIGGAPPGAWLFPLALLLSLGASDEMLRLAGKPDEKPIAWVVSLGNLAIVGSSGVAFLSRKPGQPATELELLAWPLIAFMLAILLAFVGEMVRYEQAGRVVVRVALAALSFAYVGLLLSFVVQLRLLPGNLRGMTALVSLIAVVKMGDSGAYTIGRLFGRHKMTPKLSPGKTWEGAVGAVLGAALGAWLAFRLMPQESANAETFRWGWIIYGIIVGIAGMIGDLAESLIKRDAGRKDSSAWMPGFGGILDILDSILFAAPVAWVLWHFGVA
jgi:phosphatidate cytidylyltransferase